VLLASFVMARKEQNTARAVDEHDTTLLASVIDIRAPGTDERGCSTPNGNLLA
jgi:hypothetical protein